jgi:hypothetical protein
VRAWNAAGEHPAAKRAHVKPERKRGRRVGGMVDVSSGEKNVLLATRLTRIRLQGGQDLNKSRNYGFDQNMIFKN